MYSSSPVVHFALIDRWKVVENSNGAEEVAISSDVERLVALHSLVWKMMRISPSVSEELCTLVAYVDKQLQFNKYHNQKGYEKSAQKSSLSKDNFDSKHAKRLESLGVSDNAKTELENVMEMLWRTLYDPNAYKDPSFDLELSQYLKILFENGPPKCCDESMYNSIGMLSQ